jgi:F-type H+-transporting ATPase subunit b
MNLITPDVGTVFWMFIAFLIVLFILGKFAWKPILNALKQRENSIEMALKSAEMAKKEMEKVKADNEKIMEEAKSERDNLLKEARELKEQIINEAKEQAADEANKMIETARANFRNERSAAMNEMKNQVARLSINVAEKILRQKLSEYKNQQELMEGFMKDIKFN